MAFIALAGPVANILVALISLLLLNVVQLFLSPISILLKDSVLVYVWYFFGYVAEINVYLAVFNLIPVPPLDGSRILTAFLPYKIYYAIMRYEMYIYFGLIALLYLGVLSGPLGFLSSTVFNFLGKIASLPFELFL